ncbi:GMC family oxidoreductase N-terminal domain-containing protein [Methanosphaera cuniculi]|uniref:Oxygen-dependent choline dehydrogenase n=1 Tax=Methanosphaera cuniculi TaxID=1077256 RepID=A0A2A2HDE6_9EURY|nr:GMC family oxidoreductase N-terminal domain-containing protein [Methanosphaera cuniculi]PAV07316.1 hypothetical protein ASJ82_00260 [Methanosphaera cuniculi]PWL07886.1 oxygen-dependent choline dehydrogenase [Methanosphaera cuniculi]
MKVIIIGAGTGGLSVARKLSENPDAEITIIEKGPLANIKDSYMYYDPWDKNEMELIKTTMVGGSSTVIAGNFIPSLVDELKKYDIDITKQIDELTEELNIMPMPPSHVGSADKILIKAAEKLGFDIKPMPKAIDPSKCHQCGKCAWGCPYNAKWSSLKDLEIALENGVNLITDEEVIKINRKADRITSVTTNKANTYDADIVVVAAGGMVTPKLLRIAGIDAGETFSVDPFITIGGYYKGANQTHQIEMNQYIKLPNAIISPHTSQYVLPEVQKKYPDATVDDILSFMIKIPDNLNGKVYLNKVEKSIDFDDVAYIAEAAAVVGSILKEAGVDMSTMSSTHTRGAHLIASARIGDVVDENLCVYGFENLYVADGSVLPKAEGLPPILTILAITRRLGEFLYDLI